MRSALGCKFFWLHTEDRLALYPFYLGEALKGLVSGLVILLNHHYNRIIHYNMMSERSQIPLHQQPFGSQGLLSLQAILERCCAEEASLFS